MPSLFTRRARTLAFLAFVAAAIAGRQYTSAQERALPGTLPHADVGHAGAANDGDERMYWGGRPPGASGWPGFPGGPSRPPQNRYQLGVRVKNSPTGVLIKEVVKGSPAAEARLSEGDRILSVAGHQVGYIDDRLVDLGDEINLHTGRDGRVTLLVYSARGALQNVTVSFKDASGAISGVAVYKGDLRLTQQAVLNVRLLDVSHNHWTGVVVASSSYPRANRTPFNFDFVVDSSRLYPNHRYTFEAEVVDQRGVVLRTPDPVA
ncbi:MAG TPA: YbaY family lipoprotein, partial [Pirellulales bacterium]